VLLADSTLTSGTVVLHRVSMDSLDTGEIDSVAVAPDGSFVVRLPRVPDPATQEMYFASVRHDGVMYFGDPITRPIDLDSLYVIQAYDTLMAPPEGVDVVLEARSVFIEPAGAEFHVMDVFQLRNDRDRTIVPPPGGRTWSYPLPEGARDVATEGEMSTDIASHEDGDIVLHAALPPGGRMFVIRYFVDSLTITLPTPGETEMLDVLVREPAPSLEVEGLGQDQSIQLEAGTTYRRFAGQNVVRPSVRIVPAPETRPPPVEWIAVILALVLLGGGLLALRSGPRTAAATAGADDRQSILLQLARLDEEYESESSPSAARTSEYKRRRTEHMARLRD
jgi:hypothetical protein